MQIKAFTKDNPGLLKAGKVNLDAPRRQDLDPKKTSEKSIERKR